MRNVTLRREVDKRSSIEYDMNRYPKFFQKICLHAYHALFLGSFANCLLLWGTHGHRFPFFKLESEKLCHRTLKRQMNRPSTKDRRNLNPAEFIGKDFPSPYPSWDSVEI